MDSCKTIRLAGIALVALTVLVLIAGCAVLAIPGDFEIEGTGFMVTGLLTGFLAVLVVLVRLFTRMVKTFRQDSSE